jgi:hypothetical protein
VLLIDRYGLDVLPNWHSSFISQAGTGRSAIHDGRTASFYPQSYWPGDGTGDHIAFALKYDGVNLNILSALFEKMKADELTAWIELTPTGRYARKAWFLYEFLSGRELPLPDLNRGNYLDLLEPDRYYTLFPGHRARRQRIMNNLLGGQAFCPIVRRTEKLAAAETIDPRKQSEEIVSAYPPELIRRALSYLYNKETKSSFEIENIKPNSSRTGRFIGLLEIAEHRDFCDKRSLIDAQNRIADPRFQNTDYRTGQNYVGQSVSYQKELIHYVCPKPDDLPQLMEGLLCAHSMMKEGAIPAVVHTAVISYGFVFMHPFEDGNGRIHRFLIHNLLFLRGVIPHGLMFPISAVMLRDRALYDQSLEAFSRPLMKIVEYELDDLGHMTVHSETGPLYRYIDMTAQVEALYDFIQKTIERDLPEELTFLMNYDRTRQAIQETADLPDQLIDLFIKFCLQNGGRLSAAKRKSHFEFLTDQELEEMENAFREGYKPKKRRPLS